MEETRKIRVLIKERRIVVIMPSFLGEYPGCAKGNREMKFIRAVNSFLVNQYHSKNLVIISDGCQITNKIYCEQLRKHDNIYLVKLAKQPLFSGNVRNEGLKFAFNKLNPKIITYLDSDDVMGPGHLQLVNYHMANYDWIYYSDFIAIDPMRNKIGYRTIDTLEFGKVGTSNISHRSIPGADWEGCDGYGHDWTFIKKLMALTTNYCHTKECAYMVHHLEGLCDT